MSVTHRSISVAKETTFGSLSTSTNVPDFSSLSYVSIPCERDPILIYGEVVASERNDARDGSYFVPPEPDTVFSGSTRQRRRTGTVNIRLDLSTIGYSSHYNTNYLGFLLGSGFKTKVPSVSGVTASGVTDVNNFAAAGYAAADTGTLISSIINGAVEYSAITEVNGSDITVSPAFSALTGTPSFRGLQTWYPGSRNETGQKEHSLSFRIDGVDFRTYAYGCVMESIGITLDNGRLMADMTFQAALIQDDHGNASGPIEPTYNAGAPPFFRNSYVVLSSDSPSSLTNATTANALSRIALDCEDFSLTVTNTLTPLGHSESILTMSGMEITDIDIELTLTVTTLNTTINNDYFNRNVRQLIVGTGPQNAGEGCAIMIPAAMLANDASAYDVSGNDIVRQQLTYKQSRYAGDVNSGVAYESNAGNSPFRIALGI
tara:strand:- start:128 stop:1423 length:1296 start_codon:yes stop_codon:yes gene_type:complete